MGLNDLLSKIDKTKLPSEAVAYLDEEILSDVEGLEAIQDDNKAVIALEKILRDKYPDAFIQEKKPEEKKDKMPSKQDLINDVETLKMIVEDLEGQEKEDALAEIESLEFIIEDMPDDDNKMSHGGIIKYDDGYEFIEVSKEYAKKNWKDKEIFGIELESQSEAVIESEEDLDQFELFGVEKYASGGIVLSEEDLDTWFKKSLTDKERMRVTEDSSEEKSLKSWDLMSLQCKQRLFDSFAPVTSGWVLSEGKEHIDLFDYMDSLPAELQEVFQNVDEELSDEEKQELISKVNELGYTFDFDMDGSPMFLRPIKIESK